MSKRRAPDAEGAGRFSRRNKTHAGKPIKHAADRAGVRAWATLALMSALFFIITAATFASLGLALPAMVRGTALELDRRGLRLHPAGLFVRHHQRRAGRPDPPLRRARLSADGFGGDGAGLSVPGAHAWFAALFSGRVAGGPGLHPAGLGAGHLSAVAAVCAALLSPSGFFSPSADWAAWPGRCFIRP